MKGGLWKKRIVSINWYEKSSNNSKKNNRQIDRKN